MLKETIIAKITQTKAQLEELRAVATDQTNQELELLTRLATLREVEQLIHEAHMHTQRLELMCLHAGISRKKTT